MKAARIVSVMVLVTSLAVLGFVFYATRVGDEVKVIDVCKKTCAGELSKGRNLTAGPCLLNPAPNYPDWVCDVAHSPRQPAIDDRCENMCSAYKEYKSFPFIGNRTCSELGSYSGKPANHFVELDPECNFIRAV